MQARQKSFYELTNAEKNLFLTNIKSEIAQAQFSQVKADVLNPVISYVEMNYAGLAGAFKSYITPDNSQARCDACDVIMSSRILDDESFLQISIDALSKLVLNNNSKLIPVMVHAQQALASMLGREKDDREQLLSVLRGEIRHPDFSHDKKSIIAKLADFAEDMLLDPSQFSWEENATHYNAFREIANSRHKPILPFLKDVIDTLNHLAIHSLSHPLNMILQDAQNKYDVLLSQEKNKLRFLSVAAAAYTLYQGDYSYTATLAFATLGYYADWTVNQRARIANENYQQRPIANDEMVAKSNFGDFLDAGVGVINRYAASGVSFFKQKIAEGADSAKNYYHSGQFAPVQAVPQAQPQAAARALPPPVNVPQRRASF